MFCPKCGSELPDSSNFCPQCGNDVSAVTAGLQHGQEPPETAQEAARENAQQAEAEAKTGAEASETQPQVPLAETGADAPPAETDPQAPDAPQAPATAPAPPSATAEAAQGQPASSPAGAAGLPALSRNTVVIIAAAAVIVVALAVLFVFRSPGAESTPGAIERTSANPAVKTTSGAEVRAISRPSFYDLVPAQDEQSPLEAASPSVAPYSVESGLSNVQISENVLLSPAERALLEQNGFSVTVGASGDEFFNTYETNRYHLVPSFVTVDSMMHTYHLYFSHLLKTTERTGLSGALATLGHSMLDASAAQLEQLAGTEWEDAAKRNVAFFAVGSALIDPSTHVPASVADAVDAELALVQASNGIADSPLFGQTEDYSQYAPRGYYEGDPDLERYFRAMMWYGRRNFTQNEEDLDRSALLMTLALQGGALDTWKGIYAVTSFFAGASDDCGYYEYYPIAQSVYGENVSVADLAGNDKAWHDYHALTAKMPAPKINSVVVHEGEGDDVLADEKGFRFMGQRFSLDASIFQQLIYRNVGENASGQRRMLPNALDVPAALGSDEALSILGEKGETAYAGYSENMKALRESIKQDDETLWNASLYSQWLYTINPLLEAKGEGYPAFMQSQQWTRKNLQTYLGSYTELKHDTVLYSKQALAEMGGEMRKLDDRGYVECEPEVFSRLARLTQATKLGLAEYGMLGGEDEANLDRLQQLAEQLATIATKELKGELPTDAEFEVIRSYGGQIEHFWKEVYKGEATSSSFQAQNFPAAIVTDVATDPNGQVLELGTGKVSTIYVVVPVDGSLRIARGTVFSFYQFTQPLANRLTDTEWRSMAGSVPIEDWTTGFQIADTRYSS